MDHIQLMEHHYQDPEQPFGFVFSAPEEPAPIPDAPAAGEPLLNDTELSHSNHFFEQFSGDVDVWDDSKIFEAVPEFQHEPLPSLQGFSVTMPQSAAILNSPVHNFEFTNFGHDLSARFGQAQLVSPTAADHSSIPNLDHFMLAQHPSQDGLDHKPHTTHVFKTMELFDEQKRAELRNAANHSAPPGRGLRGMQTKPGSLQLPATGATPKATNGEPRRRTLPPVNFGSDLDFRNQQYNAPGSTAIEAKSREAIFQENLRTFESHWSGESTSSSSPAIATKRTLSALNGAADGLTGAEMGLIDGDAGDDKRSKRARKTRHDEDEGDEEDGYPGDPPRSATFAKPDRRPRTKPKSRTLSESNLPPGRRKSQLADPKGPRQNLTEEEKKQNHIRSEQKRRNQIREGFADLTTMMPDASSANLSKCAILSHAVDWMAGLIDGNKKLRAQLDRMNA